MNAKKTSAPSIDIGISTVGTRVSVQLVAVNPIDT
jgi:hypothetical protein